MDAKSLLFRMLLQRVLKRTAIGMLVALFAYAWASGRISPIAGLANVYAVVSAKIGHKRAETVAIAEPIDSATRAHAMIKAAGIEPGKAGIASPQAKGAFGTNDLLCLAHAIYYEARNEPRDVQVGVAQVALNRVTTMSGQKSLCRVIYLGLGRPMGCLFAQTCRHLGTIPDDEAKWRSSIELAQDMASGSAVQPQFRQATHFNAGSMRPSWVSSVYKLAKVGRYTFYSTHQPGEEGNDVVQGVAPGALKHAAEKAAVGAHDTAAATVRAPTDADGALASRRKAANLPRVAARPAPRPERAESHKPVERERSPFGGTFDLR